jgi:hypothetical protein
MNSLEFRRALLTDPNDPRLDAVSKSLGGDAQHALDQARDFERALAQALDVPVPMELETRIMARLAAERGGSRRLMPLWLAAAASVMLAAFLWLGRDAGDATSRLMADAVAHLSHEPFALTRTERVPPSLIERSFATAGLTVDADRLPLNYLNRCPVEQRLSLHMVMRRDNGPVTALLIPDEAGIERMDKHIAGMAVRSLPYANGALVLLAESNRDFDEVETLLHAASPAVLVAGAAR